MQGVPGDVWRKPNIEGLKAASLSALGCRWVSWRTFLLGSLASESLPGAGAGFINEPRGLEICSPLASAGDKREQRLDFSCFEVGQEDFCVCSEQIGQLSTVEPLKANLPR